MECLIGIKFNDFVIIAADMTSSQSIIVMKTDENKLYKLSNKLVMAVSGESGDTTQFAEYIAKNIQLYKMRNTYELSPQEAANFTRRNLADTLRTRSPYHVNLLLAGYDEKDGPQLYYLDYLASSAKVDYAAHGYGGYFSLSIMDRNYLKSLSRDQGYNLLRKCVQEVHKRLAINLLNFKVQVIDKDGIHDMPNITLANLNEN
ncbi:proteasome subunit beta type-2-like [Anoplophora glabripennis]|uniref:proteasome subunit beta type-2-like n=1 Tax=Anoplophora glabripennis TaxID=217634 RepID=UPI000874125E|nr:proteasome subunit beta type-2-like [Anoplophora glabripennis]